MKNIIALINTKLYNTRVYVWLSFLFLSILFVLYPQIDIAVSSLFYENSEWYLKRTPIESFFYYSVRPIIIFTAVVFIAVFVFNLVKKREIFGISKRVFLYMFLVLSLAPGLIVNAGLKINWDRARPIEIKTFHGEKEFTPAFVISDQNGQSFSSGHVAAAFSLYGLALLAKRRRQFWISLTLAYGFGMCVARVAAGGHFLSDTVTSFFLVYITTNMLYHFIIEKKQ